MYHFIYKTYSPSGFYYYGRHSTLNINDGYFGSGNWIKSIKDKSKLKRDIIVFCDDTQELLEKEREYIINNIDNPKCMNFNENPLGFSSINNPNTLLKGSKVLSERFKGEKNGMYGKKLSEEQKRKISEYTRGERNPFYGKIHSEETKRKIGEFKMGKPRSEETKLKLSEALSGENHPMAKLNESQILEIYGLSWAGELSQTEIGKKYNIRQGHVTKIKNGKMWKNITKHKSGFN